MRGTPARFVDFRGGVNTKASPYLVDQTEARDARNVVSTTRGSIRKRDGCQTFSTPAVELQSLYGVESTPNRAMIGAGTDGIVYSIDAAGVAAGITGPQGTGYWAFAQAPVQGTQGPVYGVCGAAAAPIYWTGSATGAWTLVAGTMPRPQHIIYHGNRLFMADLTGGTGVFATVSDPGSALVFTDIGNPRSLPTTNIVLFDPNDGDRITGLGKVGPYLLVFKRRKTFVVYDSDTGANRRISDTVGCCAARSIAESPAGTYFLTQDRGVYRTNGSTMTLVSDKVAPTLSNVAAARRDLSAGFYFNDHYYLSISAQTNVLDLTLDFDSTLDSWWLHSYAANQWATVRFLGSSDLYGANVGANKVSQCFVSALTQDNGANFTAYWKGPWQAFGAPYLGKRLRQVHIDGVGPFDVYVNKDFELGDTLAASNLCGTGAVTTFTGTGTFAGDGAYGDTVNTQQDRVFTLGVARAWSVGFRATTNTAMEIDSYTMAYTGRRN